MLMLKEKSKGKLEACLAGVRIIADPSHCKRTYQKHMYKLTGGVRKKGWALSKGQAKKLTSNFGYFQNQMKCLTLEEARAIKMEPMHHITGNHHLCGSWCRGKQTLDKKLPYNRPPMFDLTKKKDHKTYEAVKEVHEHFTTDEKLMEMLHPHSTQPNESLNMRLCELAPKHKNYSRKKSLDYRVDMVAGHHNVGHYAYYNSVFKKLNLTIDSNLNSFLTSKDAKRRRKKDHDIKPDSKRHRRYRWQAKDQAQLLKLNTADIKMGTYESGIGCKLPKRSKSKDAATKKPRKKRKMIPCDCGGPILHYYRSSKNCQHAKVDAIDGNTPHVTNT